MKKIISIVLAVILVVMAIPFVSAATLGDVNKDGEISALDARDILQVVAGLKTEAELKDAEAADIDGANGITALDAREILQIVAGLKDAPTESEKPSEPEVPESDPKKAEMAEIFNTTSAAIANGSYKWQKACYYVEKLTITKGSLSVDTIQGTVDKFLGIGEGNGTEKDAGKYAIIPMNLKESDIKNVAQDGKYITLTLNDSINPSVGGDYPISHITNNIVTETDAENEIKAAISSAKLNNFQAKYTKVEIMVEVNGSKPVSLSIRYDLEANLGASAAIVTVEGKGKARTEVLYTDFNY